VGSRTLVLASHLGPRDSILLSTVVCWSAIECDRLCLPKMPPSISHFFTSEPHLCCPFCQGCYLFSSPCFLSHNYYLFSDLLDILQNPRSYIISSRTSPLISCSQSLLHYPRLDQRRHLCPPITPSISFHITHYCNTIICSYILFPIN
jgi:hypothetical protein